VSVVGDVFYIKDGFAYYVQSCTPCGTNLNVCTNSSSILPTELGLFIKAEKLFSCPDHAPHRLEVQDRFTITANSTDVFVTSAGGVYYLRLGKMHYVTACKPCGTPMDVCQSPKVPSSVVSSFKKSPEVFKCDYHAPHLWPGYNFVRNRAPLNFVIDSSVPVHINILMTGMGRDFTGGPLSIMHFANEMIKNGFNVRWLNVDGLGLHSKEFLDNVRKYDFLGEFAKKVRFIYNVREHVVHCNSGDVFMATLYSTAQVAHVTAQALFSQKNFIYFIQDFEPIFFPHDANFIEALESYTLPHFPIYSTSFLSKWFEYGRYGMSAYLPPDKASLLSFTAQPAMRAWPPLDADDFANPLRNRTLVVYARSHADRNAYSLTIDSLSIAVCKLVFGLNATGWNFIGLESLHRQDIILGTQCGMAVTMRIMENVPEPMYLQILRTGDVGLSLMISPHPSLPPFDFASAGLITVTNSFLTKDAASFQNVSKNFVVVQPFPDNIAAGLKLAVQMSENITFRQEGASGINWERHWDGDLCYGQPLIRKIRNWMKLHDSLWVPENIVESQDACNLFRYPV